MRVAVVILFAVAIAFAAAGSSSPVWPQGAPDRAIEEEYAFEKLSQLAEFKSIRQAHADTIAALLEKARVSTATVEEATWFTRLDDELDNPALRRGVDIGK